MRSVASRIVAHASNIVLGAYSELSGCALGVGCRRRVRAHHRFGPWMLLPTRASVGEASSTVTRPRASAEQPAVGRRWLGRPSRTHTARVHRSRRMARCIPKQSHATRSEVLTGLACGFSLRRRRTVQSGAARRSQTEHALSYTSLKSTTSNVDQ